MKISRLEHFEMSRTQAAEPPMVQKANVFLSLKKVIFSEFRNGSLPTFRKSRLLKILFRRNTWLKVLTSTGLLRA